jgi:TRAP transporter TAXI family solute receptor
VVGADSDIKNVADLKGKNISIGGVGSGTAVNAIQVLGGAGLTLDDVSEQYLNFDESSSAFQNKQVDAFFITSGIPNASIIEVANKRPVRLLVLDDTQMKALQEKYPFYVPVTVPKGTYAGMEEDLVIPSTNAVLIVAKTLPDELVYQMTKVLFEKTADLSHAKKAVINAAYAVTGVPVPFHPGAERYYKELGLIK